MSDLGVQVTSAAQKNFKIYHSAWTNTPPTPSPPVGQDLLIIETSLSHSDTLDKNPLDEWSARRPELYFFLSPFITQSLHYITIDTTYVVEVGRDSSVGIAPGYGLDGPGTESRWARDFPHVSRPALRPIQSPV